MIKNYSNFQVINEEETTEKNSSVKSAEALMGLFFKCYTIAATKIEDYKEVISDLIGVTKAEEGEDKGKLLADTITKVAGKMKPEYKDLSGDITKAGEAIKGAYSTMLTSDEGKKSLKDIKTATDKVITDSIQGLKDIVTAQKESLIFGYQSFRNSRLLEAEETELEGKNSSDRQETLNSIKSIQSVLTQQSNTGLTDGLKSFAKKGVEQLDSITKTLKDDKSWGELKRRARKEKLKEYTESIAGLEKGINELIASEAVKAGIDKKTAESIQEITGILTSITDKEKEIKIKKQASVAVEKTAVVEYKVGDSVKYKRDNGEEATSKIEKVEGDKYFFKTEDGKEFTKDKKDIIGKGEEVKKEEAKVEDAGIASGNVDKENLKKDGKNAEAIKEFQTNYNKSGYFGKILDDGRYGKNTESAIRKIAGLSKQMANKEIKTDDGKKMTKEIIELAKKLAEGK
jgi:hypothetical protein